MNCESFLSLLQFSDGLFPAGAYAHSFGLESCATEGTIRDAGGVEFFLLSYLQGSVAPTDVIAALASRRAAISGREAGLEQCLAIDHRLDVMKSASELRDASRQMGRQVLRIAANLDRHGRASLQGPLSLHGPLPLQDLIADLFRAVGNAETPGHHAMAFGVVGAAFGWPENEMACSYLYSTCAGLIAAALRLLPLGQLSGQQILWALGPSIASLAEEVQGRDIADVWSFAPELEIASMRHAMLDARLFRS